MFSQINNLQLLKSLPHGVIFGVLVIVTVDEDLLLIFLHLFLHVLLSPLDVGLKTLAPLSRLPVEAGIEALPLAPPAPQARDLHFLVLIHFIVGGPEALRGQAVLATTRFSM